MVDLNWVLKNNWIGEYKWYYSEKAGCDVGAPLTVDRMITKHRELKKN